MNISEEQPIEVGGSVQILKGRRWWQLYKRGWYKHEAMCGRCWIRFNWPKPVIDDNTFMVPRRHWAPHRRSR